MTVSIGTSNLQLNLSVDVCPTVGLEYLSKHLISEREREKEREREVHN